MTPDEHPTQPLPDPAMQWVLSQPDATPRRRWLPWVISAVVVIALAVGAWFLGELIAREIVSKTVREQIVTNLSLPADQQIDVDLTGSVLAQLIGGSLEEITIHSDDVTIGPITGDMTVQATGVPVRGGGPAESARGTVSLDVDQVRALLASVDGFPADNVGLDEPDITVSTDIAVFGATIPVGISLTPSAAQGDLVLTPASLQVAGADVDASMLADTIGPLARTVVRDWNICIAQYLPAGVVLSSVAVTGERIVADVDIAGTIISDPAMQEKGVCG